MREKEVSIDYLQTKAAFIRKRICKASNTIGTIHLGGLLSAVDITVALYYKYLNFSMNNLDNPERDKFILSKGHCGILLYSILADLGVYEWEDVLTNFRSLSHQIWQHKEFQKGIEVRTGSLGHGLSIATGMALANRDDGINSHIYCLVGDGEMQEGSNWEAIMYAGSHKLSNLVCIVDFNKCTSSFREGDNIIINWEQAFRSFGWNAVRIDARDMRQIVCAFDDLEKGENVFVHDRPTAIIAETDKGHCIEFMQGPNWHIGSLGDQDLKKAYQCIEKNMRWGN